MKRFSCGDVVPGCKVVFHSTTEEGILSQVGTHATLDHGMKEIPAELVNTVRDHIREESLT